MPNNTISAPTQMAMIPAHDTPCGATCASGTGVAVGATVAVGAGVAVAVGAGVVVGAAVAVAVGSGIGVDVGQGVAVGALAVAQRACASRVACAASRSMRDASCTAAHPCALATVAWARSWSGDGPAVHAAHISATAHKGMIRVASIYI